MASLDILILDSDGSVAYASAASHASGIVSALLAHLKNDLGKKRISLIEFGGSNYVVVRSPMSDGRMAVFVHAEDKASPLIDFILTVDISFDILNHFLTNPFEGITVVDRDSVLRYLSPVHERFFGFKRGDAIGRPVEEVIPNTRLQVVAQTGHAEIGHIQEMNGVTRVVNRVPIHRDGRVVGAIGRVLFKAPEEVHELSRQISTLRAEMDYYKKELTGLRHKAYGLDMIVGDSPPIRHLKEQIRKVAPLEVPVFISGESGSGKELVAHAIHNLSHRSEKPIVLVNSGALPDSLVESELFGYETGAFTGARREGRVGKFEMADRSSLFLDEIGDMPMETQVKLLRIVETGAFERVGSNRTRNSDFRLISATNRDLRRLIADEKFRADLYFRINGVTLVVPPLRERPADIPLLVRHFIDRLGSRTGSRIRSIHAKAVEMLQAQSWPGNVRQLQHTLQRAMIFSDSAELTVGSFHDLEEREGVPARPTLVPQTPQSIRETIGSVEGALIRESLERNNGNKKRVAEELGISRSYLYKKLAELNIPS